MLETFSMFNLSRLKSKKKNYMKKFNCKQGGIIMSG